MGVCISLVFIFVCIFCTSLRRYIGFPLDLSRLATSGLGLIPTFLSALPCCEGPSHHTPSSPTNIKTKDLSKESLLISQPE